VNYRERKQAVIDLFLKQEEMSLLFNFLPQSPHNYEDPEAFDEDEQAVIERLIDEGLIERDDETDLCTTTEEGREALIAYIRGE
jgi:hypothetical protein